MSENTYTDDLMGESDPNAKTQGLFVCGTPCNSSWELDLVARSMAETEKLLDSFGDHAVEFIEDDDSGPVPVVPLTPFEQELLDNENAIITAFANLWAQRLSIAHSVKTLAEYRAGCELEGISP